MTASNPRLIFSFLILSMLCLQACVPSNGPSRSEVESASLARSATIAESRLLYEVVPVDMRVSGILAKSGEPSLFATYGAAPDRGASLIGVGDHLKIGIFEAGPDGLFSSAQRKATQINVVVQPDGRAQIPYGGSIVFAGKTTSSARDAIAGALAGKAVQSDVVVAVEGNHSRTVSVQGAVDRPQLVALDAGITSLSAAIASAGGPVKPPFEINVRLSRGRKTVSIPLQRLIDDPREDIPVHANDEIFLAHEPQSFTALGVVLYPGRIAFRASVLNLTEASALAGGTSADYADPKGYFVFRYEDEAIYRRIVGEDRYSELGRQGLVADRQQRLPIVYRFDMTQPGSYFYAQSFNMRDKDVLYISRHPSVDLAGFVNLLRNPSAMARSIDRIVSQ